LAGGSVGCDRPKIDQMPVLYHPELDIETYNLTIWDLDRIFVTGHSKEKLFVISIDRHLADGVDRQLLSVLVHANDSENLEGLGNVA